MNKPLLKSLVFGAVFVIAAVIIFLSSGPSAEREISYTVLGESRLPVLHLYAGSVRVNPLTGYSGDVCTGEAMESLTPLGEDRVIPFDIETGGSNITGIVYEIRSIDGDDLIERTSLDTWQTDASGSAHGQIRIKDIIDDGRQYMLCVKLTTERERDIAYYSRIVRSSSIHLQEMLDYVTDFHASTFDTAAIDKYAINWEPDGTGDDESLSRVDIHSSFRNLTYRSLPVEQVGEPQLTVLDMDESFGSFRYDYLLRARNENGITDYYSMTEFFCLQWTKQRFYLMKYERRMTQAFSVVRDVITSEAINFGICDPEDVQLSVSPEEKSAAFVVAGELWVHNRDKGTLAQVFTMTEQAYVSGRLHRDYDIRIMDVRDDGGVDFMVYGYMNRGSHEGENGLSYYRYDAAGGMLTEALYMSTGHGFDLISDWMDTLCTKIGNQIYFLFDNTLYSMDQVGAEIVRMVEDTFGHRLIVNASQDTVAWSSEIRDGLAQQIRVRTLGTDENYSLTAGEGEYIRGEGFVDCDFAATIGETAKIGFYGLEELLPRHTLTVTDPTGAEIARYEKNGVFISDAEVGSGKIILKRLRSVEGAYRIIEDEVLMQNDRDVPEKTEKLVTSSAETRLKIRSFPWKSDGNADMSVPGMISAYEGSLTPSSADTAEHFFAYAVGRLYGVYERAGEAMRAVRDEMGYVTDVRGYRVWNRSAKHVARTSAALPAGVRSDMSAMALLALWDEGMTVSLRDQALRDLLRFIDKGSPVVFLDGEDTVKILVSYDPNSVWIYDLPTGDTSRMNMDDADALLEAGNRRIVSFIAE